MAAIEREDAFDDAQPSSEEEDGGIRVVETWEGLEGVREPSMLSSPPHLAQQPHCELYAWYRSPLLYQGDVQLCNQVRLLGTACARKFVPIMLLVCCFTALVRCNSSTC